MAKGFIYYCAHSETTRKYQPGNSRSGFLLMVYETGYSPKLMMEVPGVNVTPVLFCLFEQANL